MACPSCAPKTERLIIRSIGWELIASGPIVVGIVEGIVVISLKGNSFSGTSAEVILVDN